jgi:NitT/TauT family transport system ATP-binding protein
MIATELKAKNLLHLEDVYKSYGPNVILDDIDLSVSEGAFVTVVGPSGCGKTTTLRLILGQEQPTSGDIFLDQKPIGFTDVDRGIVYQRYSLFPNKTVLENVLLGKKLGKNSSLWRANKNIETERAMHFLSSVKLAEHADKFPHELSGGMQQRVAVMQALIMNPKILMMDEPFGALDPGTREDIQLFLLEQWKEHNMTIFFVTHDLEEAAFLGSRLIVVSQYYSDDRDFGVDDPRHGAKIVADHDIRHDDTDIEGSVAEKATADFGRLLEEVRHEGFDQTHLQHISEFKLHHHNSFRT